VAIERYGEIQGPGRPSICLGLAHGDWVTVCTTAPDRSADIEGQTRQVLAILEGYLMDAGSGKANLLMGQIWLKDMKDYETVNTVWNAWIDPANPPARSCVSANMSKPESLIEIRVTAAR
jgi:enamine deaminase RidA (YjgF/YER057c/UK114 family)